MGSKQRVYYDLHIHSVLSPCAEDEMTPQNIVNMSYLKQLDMIAVTDHNSCANLHVIEMLCQARSIVLIPGIEVESKEGIHLLCYFKTVEVACAFGQYVESQLGPIKNKERVFGHQWVMNDLDEVVESKDVLLIQSTTLSLEDIAQCVMAYDGVMIAAHLNKSQSIISQLGFIPPDLTLHAVEFNRDIYEQNHVEYEGQQPVFINSDAHDLVTISERVYYLDEIEKSREGFFSYFKEV